MTQISFHPLTINLDASGDVTFVQKLTPHRPTARVFLTREMLPSVLAALQQMERTGLIEACQRVAKGGA